MPNGRAWDKWDTQGQIFCQWGIEHGIHILLNELRDPPKFDSKVMLAINYQADRLKPKGFQYSDEAQQVTQLYEDRPNIKKHIATLTSMSQRR